MLCHKPAKQKDKGNSSVPQQQRLPTLLAQLLNSFITCDIHGWYNQLQVLCLVICDHPHSGVLIALSM